MGQKIFRLRKFRTLKNQALMSKKELTTAKKNPWGLPAQKLLHI